MIDPNEKEQKKEKIFELLLELFSLWFLSSEIIARDSITRRHDYASDMQAQVEKSTVEAVQSDPSRMEQLIDEMYNNFVEETIEKCKKKKREEDFAYASCGNAEKEYFDGNVMDTLSAIRALQRSVAAKSSAFKRKQFDKLSVNAIPSFMKIHLKRFF